MSVRRRPLIDRLMTRVQADGTCWRWLGALNHGGYGVIGRGRAAGNVLTHRATYEYFIADVPAGLDLDHLCRNRWCCNPWHLEPVSRRVNVARGLRAAGYGPRERTTCPYGHAYDGERTTPAGRRIRTCETCHRERARNQRRRCA